MAAPTSLCPGYTQVDAFLPDDEYEGEEEVFYVTLDMGNIEPTLVPSSSSYRLIGLDTPTPYLQLQGTILKGRHDMLLGTELIFTDDKESHDWNKRSVVHVANAEQRIAFQEVTLLPKQPSTKGKERAMGDEVTEMTFDFEGPVPPAEQRTVEIERLTGLSAPVGRAPRRAKSASVKAPPRQKLKRRASMRKREVDYEQLDPEPRETSPNDDDDMYMDT